MCLSLYVQPAPSSTVAAEEAAKQQQEQQHTASSSSAAAGEEASSSSSNDGSSDSSSSSGFGGFKQQFDSFKSRLGGSGEGGEQQQQEPLQQRASKLIQTIRQEVADAVLPRQERYSLTKQYDGPTYQVGCGTASPSSGIFFKQRCRMRQTAVEAAVHAAAAKLCSF
jgi:hypothetical protein